MKIKLKSKLIFVLEFGSVLGVVGKPSVSQTDLIEAYFTIYFQS
jgi:hypothetical protein